MPDGKADVVYFDNAVPATPPFRKRVVLCGQVTRVVLQTDPAVRTGKKEANTDANQNRY